MQGFCCPWLYLNSDSSSGLIKRKENPLPSEGGADKNTCCRPRKPLRRAATFGQGNSGLKMSPVVVQLARGVCVQHHKKCVTITIPRCELRNERRDVRSATWFSYKSLIVCRSCLRKDDAATTDTVAHDSSVCLKKYVQIKCRLPYELVIGEALG